MSGLRQPENITDATSFNVWWKSVPNREYGYANPSIPTWDTANDKPGPSYPFVRITAKGDTPSKVLGPMAQAIYAYLSKHPGEKVRVLADPTLIPEIDALTEEPVYVGEARILCSKELDEKGY